MEKKQVSESFVLGSLLAATGGFLDAYTYILRGGVFANTQTGNVVLLAINLTKMDFIKASLYMLPIVAFGSGVILSELIKYKFFNSTKLHWRQIAVLWEILILIAVAAMPIGELNIIANMLISFVCGLQVDSFRKVNGNAYATTMCTGNLRSTMEALHNYIVTKDTAHGKNFLQYIGVLIYFIIGAGLGTVFCLHVGVQAVFVCCIFLGICFFTMFIEEV